MRGDSAYAVAFKVGAIGCIVLLLSALALPWLVVLAALCVWTFVTMLILPWAYVCAMNRNFTLPVWVEAFRGPHQ